MGRVVPPGDKSVSHRIALFSLLAGGSCRVENYSPGQDCASSLNAVLALGAGVGKGEGGQIVLHGAGGRLVPEAEIDCGNSGTTMRLLMGILAGRPGSFVLGGDDSLCSRPMERVAGPLRQMGAKVTTTEGKPPVVIGGGGLTGIDYQMPVASAQLKSALLLAGLQAAGGSEICEPAASRDHSERLLAAMGAKLAKSGLCWRVEPGPLTLPASFRVPGDASSAAFFLCAAAIIPESRVAAESIMLNPTRIGFLEVLKRMGARVEIREYCREPEPTGEVRVSHGPRLRAVTVTASEIPSLLDEAPILALVASQAVGVTRFCGVAELKVKETDRVAAIRGELGKLGVETDEEGDDLLVHGPTKLFPAPGLNSRGDHRMAMTLRLAGVAAGGWPAIKDEACAAVSYPGFDKDLKGLLA